MRDGVADEWGRSSCWTGTLGRIAKKVTCNAKRGMGLLQLSVLHLGLFQDGDVEVGRLSSEEIWWTRVRSRLQIRATASRTRKFLGC